MQQEKENRRISHKHQLLNKLSNLKSKLQAILKNNLTSKMYKPLFCLHGSQLRFFEYLTYLLHFSTFRACIPIEICNLIALPLIQFNNFYENCSKRDFRVEKKLMTTSTGISIDFS